MALTAPAPSRRRRGLTAAACAAVAAVTAVPTALAAPALAQDAGSDLSGATRAAALVLTVNLPQGNTAVLALDPVTGTVRSVGGSSPEAEAAATLISGSLAGEGLSTPTAMAKLPSPTESREAPLAPVTDGIAGSPLAALLALELLESTAAVTPAPGSTSEAQIASLGVGLPAEVLTALTPVLEPLVAGIDQLLTELAGGAEQVEGGVCGEEGVGQVPSDDVINPIVEGITGASPGLGSLVDEVIGGLPEGEVVVLCQLSALLNALNDELQESLATLAGPGGLLSVGLISAEQSIVRDGARVTSTATTEIADLAVLGQSPFGEVDALRTTSVATADGTAATATVDAAAVEVVADPLAELRTDLEEITGYLADIELDGATELLVQLEALFDALLGIGIDAGRLGSPSDAIDACPTELATSLSGTFEAADGTCAAAAARGYGLSVTLPAELAEPLGLAGPLVELAVVPSAAVAKAQPVAATQRVEAQGPLPRTGAEVPLAAAGLALLVGAGLVRRRRGVTAE